MQSSLRFKRQVAEPDITVGSLLRSGGVLDRWKRHIDSWLAYPDQRRRLTVIRYEDLVRDTVQELGSLFRILGIDVSADSLRRSADLSGIESMQQSENEYKERNPRYQLNLVKPGSTDELSAYEEEIAERTRQQRMLLGYCEQ